MVGRTIVEKIKRQSQPHAWLAQTGHAVAAWSGRDIFVNKTQSVNNLI